MAEPRGLDLAPVDEELERHRPALTGYCHRMLGSPFDAEDAVQDTLVRAWRGMHRLERRAVLGAWLYRIATNVCVDMLQARARRAHERVDERLAAAGGDPADLAAAHESLRHAFSAALWHLAPRQRAALILCEVLGWRASEAAELLGTSVGAVTSALQRARAALAAAGAGSAGPAPALGPTDRALLARYVGAFERHDVRGIVALVREDASRSPTSAGRPATRRTAGCGRPSALAGARR
jgi:RNA polymerase sigma-70 factor (ECF subfamily)